MNSPDPKVAVIIVNWNRRDLVLEAVESCVRSSWSNLLIIVVDNGSVDDSVEALREKYPQVEIICNESNLGFAVGSNQGIDLAFERSAEFIFFLNNDATLDEAAISLMILTMKVTPEISAVSPYIFYHDRRELIWYGGGETALWRGKIAHSHLRENFKPADHQARITDYLTGCVFMVRSDVLEQIGGFDTTLGIYSEDVDWSLRMRRADFILWVTPQAKAYHRISASAGGELSPFKAFHRARSNAVIFKRWAAWWEWFTLIPGGITGGCAISFKLLLSGRFATAIALWQGILNGLLGREIPASRGGATFLSPDPPKADKHISC